MAGATATNQYFMAPNMSDVSANPKDWWKSFALGMGTQVNPETGATENIMAPGGPGMSSAFGLNGTVIDLFLNRKDRKEQEKKAEEAQLGIDKFHASEKKGLYDPKFNQSLADAYSFGVRSTDTSGIQSAAQTAMNAASADPRVAAGMINQVQGNLGNQMLAANQSDMMRQQQQMLGYGQKKQALGEQATAFDKELGLTKLGEDKQAYNTAQQNLEALKQQKRQTFANMANNASDLAMTAIGMPPFPKMGNGGMLPYAKGGMTPGEFSHERNPIHMMDDMGNKVGEATGGEMILNPDQSDAIEGAFESMGSNPSKDDLMYLYEVVRGIFSQPQFKD